jgi:hypothetical protein
MNPLIALIGFAAAAAPCKSEFDFNLDGVMDGRTRYVYDAQHQLSWEHFTSPGHGALRSDTQYRHDDKSRLIESTLFVSGKPAQRQTLQYEEGRLTVEEVIQVVPECLRVRPQNTVMAYGSYSNPNWSTLDQNWAQWSVE